MTPRVEINALGQTIDLAEGARAGRLVRALDKQCWWNAVAALRRCYRQRPEARYVEGYAISRFGLPMAHGWVELNPTHIVEVTPSWRERGPGESAALYFAGERYSWADLRGRRIQGANMPLAHSPGRPSVAVLKAELAAYRHSFGPSVDQMMPHVIAAIALLEAGHADAVRVVPA